MAKSLSPRRIGENVYFISSRQEQKKDKMEECSPKLVQLRNEFDIKSFKSSKTSNKKSKLHKFISKNLDYSTCSSKSLVINHRTIYHEDFPSIFVKKCRKTSSNQSKAVHIYHKFDLRYSSIQTYLRHARFRTGVSKVEVLCYHKSTVSIEKANHSLLPFLQDIKVKIYLLERGSGNVSVRLEDENNDVHCISLSNPSTCDGKVTGQQIHDLTSLPHSKSEPAPVKIPPNSVRAVICPSGRRKPNRGGQLSRQRQQNSQNQNTRDEDGNLVPVQARDNVTDMPNRENTVTSIEPVFGRSGVPVTTNLMSSIDSEEMLASRRRGRNQNITRAPPLRPARYPEYADREKRQDSFTTWPQSTMQDPSNMAEQGFFFTGRQDLVRCFQCGIGMKDWSEADEPLFEHVRHSPECNFLLEHLGPELLAAYKINLIPSGAQPATQRSTGQTGSRQASPTNTSQGNTALSGSQGTGSYTTATSTATSNVRSPQYSTMDARIRSFNNRDWPTNITQTPHQLAEAGFYFSGYGDVCRCFTCDGGLQRWDPQDDPWIEHARWFPECDYVRQTRGQDYIDLVQRAATQSSDEDSDPVVQSSLSGAMAGLSLNDSESLSTEAARKVLDKGYSRKAVLLAIHELQVKGSRELTEQSILAILKGKQDRGEALPTDTPPNEAMGDPDPEKENDPNYLQQENERLRRKIKCIRCDERDANILFIPCTHHRMCEECANDTVICPVCGRDIEKKVKTYMS